MSCALEYTQTESDGEGHAGNPLGFSVSIPQTSKTYRTSASDL